MGHVTSYSYTPTVQIAKVSDPGGTTSEYVYDLKDRLVQVRRGGTLKEEYRYDKADNLIEKLDSKGKPLLTFEIGPHNLKAVRHLSSGEIHRFAYDKHGRFAELATKESRVRFDYDIFGNRTLDERDGLGVKHEFLGPRQLSSSTVLDRFTVNYRRLPDGTILITDPGGGQHSVRLLGGGLVLRTMSNGSSELTRFDAAGRCLLKATIRHRSFATPWTRAYSYSGEGEMLQVEDSVNGTIRYEYDAAHRLRREVNGKATESYGCDAAGNLLEQPVLSGV
jgi:YD repeat-containing protein